MQNEIITVANTEMQVKEYNGQRVVTFDDICEVHECERKRLTKHFSRKRKHFISGEDFFELTRRELGDMVSPNSKITGNPNIKTYLFTESGYLMIIKCLDDDLSWTVQRQLVNGYFKAREQAQEQKEKPKVPEFDEFPELMQRPQRVSNTRLPRNPSWFERNRRRMERICRKHGITLTNLYHHILVYLGECFEMNGVREAYKMEVGHYPIYAMDIVQYFSELGDFADEYLDEIERKTAR